MAAEPLAGLLVPPPACDAGSSFPFQQQARGGRREQAPGAQCILICGAGQSRVGPCHAGWLQPELLSLPSDCSFQPRACSLSDCSLEQAPPRGCGEWGKEPGKHVLLSTGWNAVGYVMGILIPAGKTGGCQGLFWACLAPLPSLDEAAEAWEGRQRGERGAEGRGLRRGLPRAAAFCSISPTLMAVQRTG